MAIPVTFFSVNLYSALRIMMRNWSASDQPRSGINWIRRSIKIAWMSIVWFFFAPEISFLCGAIRRTLKWNHLHFITFHLALWFRATSWSIFNSQFGVLRWNLNLNRPDNSHLLFPSSVNTANHTHFIHVKTLNWALRHHRFYFRNRNN